MVLVVEGNSDFEQNNADSSLVLLGLAERVERGEAGEREFRKALEVPGDIAVDMVAGMGQ